MSPNTPYISDLIGKYLLDSLTPIEKRDLEDWLASSTSNLIIFNEALNSKKIIEDIKQFDTYNIDSITHKITLLDDTVFPEKVTANKLVRMGKPWIRYAAAVLLVIFSSVAVYYLMRSEPDTAPAVSITTVADVLPGTDKAILTLSNGQQVSLDSATSNQITEKDIVILHENGKLIYENAGSVVWNTMTTPKGGQYRLQLADGTKIWLNAMSSVRFPTAFKGANRTISITGEVYLEVAPNKSSPFIVHTPDDTVTVLGTSFNINSYPEENPGKISLLTGSIKVNKTTLAPGEAIIGDKVVITDLQKDIAWKNGLFDFSNADVPAIMRELSRWYDVDIIYDGEPSHIRFNGNLQRKLTLSQVIRSLSEVDIRLQLNGRTLHVK